ncbi:MAG: cation acetate symporter [Planctomycetales bacterium]|nr:cation acetate symporter [Planctomycetales bacterium]
MIYNASMMAVAIFLVFVGFTLALSFYLGGRAKSSAGYFTAHGQIPWFVNGIAFAGDYLSAASFLGICGMIAFYGYDGFLYSIGYLAGWIVALFVIAEPMKRLGKFTFADALNSKFQSRGIQLAAGISTLAVSVFYLIPQMVGAGVLVRPLLGFPHWAGVVMVGAVVILIVVTAGMVSTTWVQFLKGSLLVAFSAVLTVMILQRGLEVQPGGRDGHVFSAIELTQGQATEPQSLTPQSLTSQAIVKQLGELGFDVLPQPSAWSDKGYWRVASSDGRQLLLRQTPSPDGSQWLRECQTVELLADGTEVDNGQIQGTLLEDGTKAQLYPTGFLSKLPQGAGKTGSLGPLSFFRTLNESEVILWGSEKLTSEAGQVVTIYYPKPTPGSHVLRPGEHPIFSGIRQPGVWPKLNFLSLMLALFCGTASLPHILIRYYTVKDASAARKSTIVGIAAIGFFYVLTLYMGLGAMTSGSLDVTNSNMAAPLLARSMNEWLFAMISAIAFTTVLGTVSGLILASAGAVSHDILKNVVGLEMSDHQQVRIAKLASVAVGMLAIALGILFEKMNVNYLVGWAFSVAASANLPALVMLLFWPRTTKQGIIAAVIVGMASSLGWILLSQDTFSQVYAVARPEWLASVIPFSQPGIVTIPLSFLTLVLVSLATQNRK